MAPSRTRSPSLSRDERAPKRVKTSVKETSVAGHFYPGLLNPENTEALRVQYAKSEPFLHGVIDKLFDETLLRNASEEILREISFTVKETDIYKVHQTGDLASLSYLTPEQLSLFPSLLTLRNALYSPEFRSYVRKVTGCGPLSGNKQDMSVNSYRNGCHLLNHDDVIGSRRVSYILYMPLPIGEDWKAEYGGALELYPMLESVEDAAAEGRLPEPATVPSKIIPPSWNQFVFFEIQPGKSFHSVEEVVVDLNEHGRQRLSISGWFHKPQPGEEGYAEEDDAVDRLKSSLEQLSEAPPPPMKEYTSEDMQPVLSTEDRAFLARFINEAYLSPANMPAIVNSFAENSEIQLQRFLRPPLARRLQAGLQARDREDKLSISERPRSAIPPHTSGATARGPWSIHGPPHKRRFCTLAEGKGKNKLPGLPADDALDEVDVETLLLILQNSLFSSDAFRAWLALLSGLIPLKYQLASRRFRPGLDYTLATAHEEDARLDVVLDLTPEPEASSSNGKSTKKAQGGPTGWHSGEWGGWLCYMAPDEGEEDPAVYRSSSSKKNDHRVNGNGHSGHSTGSSDGNGPAEVSDDEGDEQEEDSTLLTVQPAFNRLLLTLRDARVLHFVKYVSASAHGSRWDICGEWEVGMVADSDDEETHGGQ